MKAPPHPVENNLLLGLTVMKCTLWTQIRCQAEYEAWINHKFLYPSTRLRHTHSHRLLPWVITTLLWLHKIACKCNQASQLAPSTFSLLSSPLQSFSSTTVHLFCVSVVLFHFSFSSCYLSLFPSLPWIHLFPKLSFSCLSSPSPSTSQHSNYPSYAPYFSFFCPSCSFSYRFLSLLAQIFNLSNICLP